MYTIQTIEIEGVYMKVSTKGRYGLKAIIDVATHGAESCCVTIKSISERQGIPENYLEQLMATLKKAGFVKSTRGAQGGYVLSRRPEEISVGDLLRTLEGPLVLVDCDSNKQTKSCGSGDCKSCVTKDVWKKMSDSIVEVADSINLSDLIMKDNS